MNACSWHSSSSSSSNVLQCQQQGGRCVRGEWPVRLFLHLPGAGAQRGSVCSVGSSVGDCGAVVPQPGTPSPRHLLDLPLSPPAEGELYWGLSLGFEWQAGTVWS